MVLLCFCASTDSRALRSLAQFELREASSQPHLVREASSQRTFRTSVEPLVKLLRASNFTERVLSCGRRLGCCRRAYVLMPWRTSSPLSSQNPLKLGKVGSELRRRTYQPIGRCRAHIMAKGRRTLKLWCRSFHGCKREVVKCVCSWSSQLQIGNLASEQAQLKTTV